MTTLSHDSMLDSVRRLARTPLQPILVVTLSPLKSWGACTNETTYFLNIFSGRVTTFCRCSGVITHYDTDGMVVGDA